MTDAPADLTAFVHEVRAACGFTDPNEVGMLPNQAHLKGLLRKGLGDTCAST